MRAPIGRAYGVAAAVAPQQQPLAKPGDSDRLVPLQLQAVEDRIPLIRNELVTRHNSSLEIRSGTEKQIKVASHYSATIHLRASDVWAVPKTRTSPGISKRKAPTACLIQATSVTTAARSQRERCSIPSLKYFPLGAEIDSGEVRTQLV